MVACPSCHIFKGLFSDMKQNKKDVFVCPANPSHKFTRDKEGNFHSV
jgi:hypothetical protein